MMKLLDAANFKNFIGEFNREKRPHYNPLNNYFMAGDADIYYAMVRWLMPQHILEVGAGHSTIIADMARKRNNFGTIVAIEPRPSDMLKNYARQHDIKILQQTAQSTSMDEYLKLECGDILFIDSSHIYDKGSDVEFLLNQVLPSLPSGVFVHFHDIVVPYEYKELYANVSWNEQEHVMNILNDYYVWWFGSKVSVEHPELLRELFPDYAAFKKRYAKGICSSLWLMKN